MATATKQDKSELDAEYKARAEADFNPNETLRERAERLKVEAAAAEQEAIEKEREETAAKLESLFHQIAETIEKQNPGKVCRAYSVRYAKPGDEKPGVVKEMEPKSAGIAVRFKAVRPRAANKSE